jgi:hypothetical protein
MPSMTVIYIAPPVTLRGRWRVRAEGSPEREVDSQEAAIRYATDRARLVEGAGGEAVIKIEKPDGIWEVFRR